MSHISVSSATQISRDDMDVETDGSAQLHDLDHPYSAPHQVAEVTDVQGSVREALLQQGSRSPEISAPVPTATSDTSGAHFVISLQEIKPEYDELKPVKLEPEEVNLSPRSSYPQEHYAQNIEETADTLPLDNNLITGLILQIPVKDVPYSVHHDDLIKALSVADDKIAVRTMRKVIPCLRITTYITESEYLNKKKIKGLWTVKPKDWPEFTPYKDPNNGEKVDGRVVPKANSEELKQMFGFLKKKFMQNIQKKLKDLSSEQLDILRTKASQQKQEYDFSQQPSTPKSCSPTYSQSQIPRTRQPIKEPVLVKQELGTFFTQQSSEGNQIPTLVDQFCNSSPETDYSNDQAPQVYAVTGNYSGDYSGLQLPPGKYAEHTDPSGNTYLVRLPGSPSSTDSEFSPPAAEVPETMLETAPQDVRTLKRPAPVETQGEGAAPVVVSGKRVCEEEEPEFRGPIQQVSSPSAEMSSLQTPGLGLVSSKATIEVAPQLRSNIPTPQSSQQQPAQQQTPSSALPMAPSSFNPSSMLPVYSPVSPMPLNPSSQYRTDLRGSLIHDLHSRIRDKISYVSNLTLGDVDLSIKLNTMYKVVLWSHYERAQKNEPNNFINAVHECEALVERAIVDGINFPREAFKDNCDAIIAKYTGDGELTQKLVLNVAEPEHPPIQSQVYTKLQSESSLPSPVYPKSPGTFLSKEMGQLQLEKSVGEKVDVTQLGIRTKVQPSEVLDQLQNMGILQRPQPPQPEENENLLLLPEKLEAIGCEVNPEKINDEALRDIFSQLDDFNKLQSCNEDKEPPTKAEVSTVHESTEVITIEDDSDCEGCDIVNLQQPSANALPGYGMDVGTPVTEATSQTDKVQTEVGQGPAEQWAKVSNSAAAPASWYQAEQEMKQALEGNDQPSGLMTGDDGEMDTSELVDAVMGLEDSYNNGKVAWKESDEKALTQEAEVNNRVVQPSTADAGHFYLASSKPEGQPPPPYPGMTVGNLQPCGEEHNAELLRVLASMVQSGDQTQWQSFNSQSAAEGPGLQLSIPEVVQNFDQMDCSDSEPKPGTRGRKRGLKGKAKK